MNIDLLKSIAKDIAIAFDAEVEQEGQFVFVFGKSKILKRQQYICRVQRIEDEIGEFPHITVEKKKDFQTFIPGSILLFSKTKNINVIRKILKNVCLLIFLKLCSKLVGKLSKISNRN